MLNLVSRIELTSHMTMHVIHVYGLSFVYSKSGKDKL